MLICSNCNVDRIIAENADPERDDVHPVFCDESGQRHEWINEDG